MQREHTFQHTLLDVGLLPLLPLINALWQMLRPSRLDSQDPTPPGDFSLSPLLLQDHPSPRCPPQIPSHLVLVLPQRPPPLL